MITAHMMVKNEDQWVWYTIQSVLPYVDQFLICDTGSTDKTIDVIKSIQDPKIIFTEMSARTPEAIAEVRNQQLEATHTEWLWMVDGDEIYPSSVAKEIVNHLKSELAGVIVRRMDCLGDIYHYQPDETVGAYSLAGRMGHYNLRLVNCSIPGLHLSGKYPKEGFYDQVGHALVDYNPDRFYVTAKPYLHTTYLMRSSLGGNLSSTMHRKKYKIELGKKIPPEFLPEIINGPIPNDIPKPIKRGLQYELKAACITPIKMLKRKLIS